MASEQGVRAGGGELSPRVVRWPADMGTRACPCGVIAPASVVTIGVFDGLHLGHQTLIAEAVAAAPRAGVPCACVTFYPSPEIVLRGAEPRYLLLPEERVEILGDLGVDIAVIMRFDRTLAALDAASFMGLLHDCLHPMEVWIGDDFALGHGRQGDAERLRALGAGLEYRLAVVPRVRVDGEVVSSTLVRTLLRQGDVGRVARLLGRPYRLSGVVQHGFGVGARLG